MIGGLGNDIYFVDSALDRVTEEAGLGSGVDTIVSSVSLNLSSTTGTLNVENLSLAGFAFSGVGNGINNSIFGNDVRNSLSGLGGSDNLFGFGGDDTLGRICKGV
jgi:Ca2+-binding RTX toxin-like protein